MVLQELRSRDQAGESFLDEGGALGRRLSALVRHSPATHAKRRGADLDFIMRTLRHALLATAGCYLHAVPSDFFGMYLGL